MAILEKLWRQTLAACLNELVYGSLFIVAMYGIAALDMRSALPGKLGKEYNFDL